MNPNQDSSKPHTDATPMTFAELRQWLLADPANQVALQQSFEKTLRGEFDQMTPEVAAAAKTLLASVKAQQGLKLIQEGLDTLAKLMDDPDALDTTNEGLAHSKTLMDELTDQILDLSEPHRTRLLTQLHSTREKLLALRP